MDHLDVAADFVTLGVSQLSELRKHMHFGQLCHMELFGQPLFVPDNHNEAELSLDSEPGTTTSCPITQTYLKMVHDALTALPNTTNPEEITTLIKTKVNEYNETLKQRAEEALKHIPRCWFEEE